MVNPLFKQSKITMPFKSLAARMAIFSVLAIGFFLYMAYANPFYTGGYPKAVEDGIPQEHESLRILARHLAAHNDKVHEDLKLEMESNRSLGWFMGRYPERFSAPADWFTLVAQTEGIPVSQMDILLRKSATGVISTGEAADWVLGVYLARKESRAFESQQDGVKALREAVDQKRAVQ